MYHDIENPHGVPLPWRNAGRGLKKLGTALGLGRGLALLVRGESHAWSWSGSVKQENWRQESWWSQSPVKRALQEGYGRGTRGDHRLQALALSPRWGDANAWVLASRSEAGWTEDQARSASSLLSAVQSAWDQPNEPGLVECVVDEAGRPVCISSASVLYPWGRGESLAQTLATTQALVGQWWPDGIKVPYVEFTLGTPKQPLWVRRAGKPLPSTGAGTIYHVEIRAGDPSDPPPILAELDPRVAQALGYLIEHSDEPPNLNALAGQAGLSSFHLHRLFLAEAGITPKQYQLRLAVRRCRWLLQQSGMPIAEIADLGGFASHGHFTTTFRRVTGLKPSDYRTQG